MEFGARVHPMSMRERVGHDHVLAAMTANLRQRALEETAAAANMSAEEYMKATGTLPVTDFRKRSVMDEMEADYLRAFLFANARERERDAQVADDEARAIQLGMTVEQFEFMQSNKMWPPPREDLGYPIV